MGNTELIKVAGFYNRHGPPRKLSQSVELWTLAAGPARGMSVFFEGRNTHVEGIWEGDKQKTEGILARKPVILVSNHPHALEPLMLLSQIPSREDISIVGASPTQKLFGKEFGEHIVPVYKPLILEKQQDTLKRRRANMRSIDRAIDKLQYGNAVLIAPDGGEGTDVWKKGSVRLVDAALSMPEAHLVMGYVSESAAADHWKVIFNKELHRSVHISEAINVQDLPIPQALRAMPTGDRSKLFGFSRVLTDYYRGWTKGL